MIHHLNKEDAQVKVSNDFTNHVNRTSNASNLSEKPLRWSMHDQSQKQQQIILVKNRKQGLKVNFCFLKSNQVSSRPTRQFCYDNILYILRYQTNMLAFSRCSLSRNQNFEFHSKWF